jgi:hypothetical protein
MVGYMFNELLVVIIDPQFPPIMIDRNLKLPNYFLSSQTILFA